SGNRAFRWTSAGGMVNLGVLSGGNQSYGNGLSADGAVPVGYSGATGGNRAFRWTSGGGLQNLGTPSGASSSTGLAANADGSVVVGASFSPAGFHAILWNASLGMVDLNTYLPSLGIDLSGWTLAEADAISPDGRTLVGSGSHNGVDEAWLAHLPVTCVTAS